MLEKRYTVACPCGWTSSGHHSWQEAREAYREHQTELSPLAREVIRSRAEEAAALARPLAIENRDHPAEAQRLEELDACRLVRRLIERP